jgi:hypothetical protein
VGADAADGTLITTLKGLLAAMAIDYPPLMCPESSTHQ